MLIDISSCIPLTRHDFSSLPKEGVNVVKRFTAGGIQILFEKNPPSASGEDLVYIHYSLIAKSGDDTVCVVSVESLDLRSLALSLGESVKEIQREYGTRGFLAPAHLVIYGNGEKEEMEGLSIELRDEYVLPYMMDFLLDALDCADDVVPLD